MRVSMVTGPGETDVLEVPDPSAGPADVLVKMKACCICGSDALYIAMGGLPSHHGRMPLGHEPADEAVIVSQTFGFDDVQDALRTALTPGAADKVVVTFD